MSYIEREKIALTDFEIAMCNGNYKELCEMILDKINSIPAADVREVKRGKWEPVMYKTSYGDFVQDRDEWYGPLFKCRLCNWTMIGRSRFCPNCGAKMEES